MDNLDVEMLIDDIENLGPERVIAVRNDNFYEMDDVKFVSRYRLSKQVVLKLLDEIEPMLEYPTNRNRPLLPIQQLLLTLRYFATGSFQIVNGDCNGVSKSTVSRYVKKVSEAIASLRPRYVQFPEGAEATTVIQEFYAIANFPGVVGAIDCTHVPILTPVGHIAEIYRNGKSYFSLNIQTVCDANLLIRNIVARWPGSTHDSLIFNNSELRMLFETGRLQGILLGDNGYRLTTYLMTPFLNCENNSQNNYNCAHIKTRNTVERQCGLWKRRFPSLSLGLRTAISTSLVVIVATAVLHNIAMQTKEAEPPEDLVLQEFLKKKREQEKGYLVFEEVPAPNVQIPDVSVSAAARERIVQNHFA